MKSKKLKALIKASNQLSNAWLDVYQVSKSEMTGEFYEIRQELNSLELKMVNLIQEMQEEQEETEE